MNNTNKMNIWLVLIILFIGILIWLPRGFGLDQFVTTDEVVWLWRSGNFYYSLGQRDFTSTYMNRSPGVVTMWIETFAMLLKFPQYRGFGQGFLDKYSLFEKLLISNGIHPHDILTTSRWLMVLLNTTVTAVAFPYAKKLFGFLPAFVGFLLIAFEPFHIGVTRLSHLDGPMASFLFLSLLAFISFLLHNNRQLSTLAVSSVAGGLAVLSKIPSFIILPSIGLLILIDFFYWHKNSNINLVRFRIMADLLKPIILWVGIFILTIFIFLPAMWKRPVKTLWSMMLSPINFAEKIIEKNPEEGENESPSIISTPKITLSATLEFETAAAADSSPNTRFAFEENFWQYISRYPVAFYRNVSPFTILGICIALVTFLFRPKTSDQENIFRGMVGLLIFVVLYTILLTIPPKSSRKYYIPVYPIFNLLAGIGWVSLANWAKRIIHFRLTSVIPILILGMVIIFQFSQAIATFPYYLTYYNPLAGNEHVWGSGEGLDQAAKYLNRKLHAEDLKVLSWYGIGPFSYYFVGKTFSIHPGAGFWDQNQIERLKEMDYIVTYQNQWIRNIPAGINEFLAGVEPEYEIWINNSEYARIYDVKSIPIQ